MFDWLKKLLFEEEVEETNVEIEKIDFYDISADNGSYKFMVTVFCTDYNEVSMSYDTVDFNYYELWNYSIRYNQ